MHRIKASDLISLRRSLSETQPALLSEVRDRVSPALRDVLDSAVASTWLNDPDIAEIYAQLARALYPGAISPNIQLGRHMALLSYRGVYRVFLSIPSTSFVIGKAASVWASYHSTGRATMEEVTARSAVLVVRGAQPISKTIIDVVTGHILALAELTGAKEPLVVANGDDPAALRWAIRWKH